MTALRLRHKLTAHHWRRDRRTKASSIAICSCGWKCRLFRRIDRRTQLRGLLCLVPGHRWGDTEETHGGPVGFEESEDTLLGRFRQCQRCYCCEDIP